MTGAPVSPRFARVEAPSRAARQALGLATGDPVLAVLGGSQGAGGLNAFLRAIAPRLSAAGVQVVHQVGPGRLDESADDSRGYTAKEYIDDVPALLAAADLVLCRGGASTLAEVGAVGVPSWVVPYPHHADQHQAHNARALGDGTRVVPEDQLEATEGDLLRLLSADGAAELARMRAHLGSQVPADAARVQCQRLLRLAGLA